MSNTYKIVALEMMCAAQAVDLQLGESRSKSSPTELLGRGTRIAYEEIRRKTRMVEKDRQISEDLNRVTLALESGDIFSAIEQGIQL